MWDTLERLVGAGVELGVALGQVRMVLLSTMHVVIGGDECDDDEYRCRLERLPLPDAGLVEDVFDRLAAKRRVAETDELIELIEPVIAELGGEPDDRMLRMLVERGDGGADHRWLGPAATGRVHRQLPGMRAWASRRSRAMLTGSRLASLVGPLYTK